MQGKITEDIKFELWRHKFTWGPDHKIGCFPANLQWAFTHITNITIKFGTTIQLSEEDSVPGLK